LALIRRAVAEIGQRHVVVAAITIGECEAGAERHLRADDAVAAEKSLLDAEHVHRAALAARVAVAATRELRHHTLGVHAAGEHVTVIAIAGDDLVALFQRELHADHDSFLADVEMAEAADQTHAVHLAGLLFEAADHQHVAIGGELLVLGQFSDLLVTGGPRLGGFGLLLSKRHEIALRTQPGTVFDEISRGERGAGRPCSRLAYISQGRKPAAVEEPCNFIARNGSTAQFHARLSRRDRR
jgi:hypothetical protein